MKQDTLNRYQWIETQLYWGGGFTASELGECFGIARQNAQVTIGAYRKRHPRNLIYDRRARRHRHGEDFTPHYIPDKVEPFLNMIRGDDLVTRYRDEDSWTSLPFVDADRPLRTRVREIPVQQLLAGLREKKAVNILYCAKSGTRQRSISPHHLIHADGRFHVRAFCHTYQKFMDFVLSRVIESSESSEEWVSEHGDQEWNERVKLIFQINPKLPDEAKDALRADYRVDQDDHYTAPDTRQAVSEYTIRRLTHIDNRYQMPLWLDITPAQENAR